ncbi:MAG: hypothetical protein HYX82_01935 [Chloroflexi bacterium]|nr:hypothetical protein [Chloroflexota bacterium]
MLTKPVEDLLHKPYDNRKLTDTLGALADAIEETVNFGTHVLKWSAEAGKTPEDLQLLMLLRHELGLAYAISVLVRNSCIEPTAVLLRGMFETFLQTEYILESDSRCRGLAFRLWRIHEDLKWREKLDGSTQVGKQFKKAIQSDKMAAGMEVPDLQQQMNNLRGILDSDEFKEVEAEYQRLVNSGAKHPAWYSLFKGPKDVEQLARYLRHPAMYEILYRSWSGTVHGTDISRGKISWGTDGVAHIWQILSPKNAEEPTSLTISFCLGLYQLFIKHYAPARLKQMREWYESSIRSFYAKITKEKIIQVS